MNFLRTQTLMRIADSLKLTLNGTLWKTQSNLDVVVGKGLDVAQTETKDLTTLTLTTAKTGGPIGYYGSFWDNTTQTAASTTTAYVITCNQQDGHLGVELVDGSKLTVTYPGVYNLAFSVQVSNADTQAHDATFWIRKNGTDITQSASIVTVPSTHGGITGKFIFYYDIIQQLAGGDYLEIVWAADSTNLSLATIPAGVSPTHPQSPAVMVSFLQI